MADRANKPSSSRGGGARSTMPSSKPRGSGLQQPQGFSTQDSKPKREAILDLSKYVNEPIRVKFMGGREVVGTLKGYDQLLNLVLDDVEEQIQEPEPSTRSLGLVVLRGPLITIVSPVDGSDEIANPFMAQE